MKCTYIPHHWCNICMTCGSGNQSKICVINTSQCHILHYILHCIQPSTSMKTANHNFLCFEHVFHYLMLPFCVLGLKILASYVYVQQMPRIFLASSSYLASYHLVNIINLSTKYLANDDWKQILRALTTLCKPILCDKLVVTQ